jgi:hypothetical protein
MAAAGVACLHGSWQDRIAARWYPVPIGWALLLASAWAWALASGAEFGISVALLLPTVLAWLTIARNAQLRSSKPRSNRMRRPVKADSESKTVTEARTALAHLRLFLVSVPLAGVASTYVTIALCSLLPMAQGDQLVLALLVVPFAWGAAAYWALADSNWLRPALTILASGIVAALVHL